MDRVFASVTAGERIRHFETEIVRPDGLPIPVSLSLAPVTDDDGAILGSVVVVARDVTEQHLAQATLAEIDARLEEGEALAHVGSWLWDLRTGAVQWSAEFHRIHGIDPLDFAGTFESYMDLIAPRPTATTRAAAMTESVEASRPLDLEYRVVHPDQKVHVVRVHANPTLGSDGKAVGLRGIGQDVTDADRARSPAASRSPSPTPTGQASALVPASAWQPHPHVGEDAQHQHRRRRHGEVPDVEDLLAADDQPVVGTRLDA